MQDDQQDRHIYCLLTELPNIMGLLDNDSRLVQTLSAMKCMLKHATKDQ